MPEKRVYEDHWGLQRRPFEATFDAEVFFRSSVHEAALAKLIYAAESDQGPALLVGPAGTGKTAVLTVFMSGLDRRVYLPALVPAAFEKREDMLFSLLDAFGERPRAGEQAGSLQAQLEDKAKREARAGRRLVPCVDEAHLLGLEAIDSLATVCALPEKIFLTVAGRPELSVKLEGSALKGKFGVSASLGPFSEEESTAYVLHRLRSAGAVRGIFTRKGSEAAARMSRGLPGELNRLCETCLVTACGLGLSKVGPEVVREAAKDLGMEE